MKYIKRSEINTEKWDACISRSENALIYGYSWFLDAATTNQWDALIWGDYQNVMPLPWNRKLTAKQVYMPMTCQQLGWFGKHNSDINVQDVIQFLKKNFIRVNYSFQSENHLEWLTHRENFILPLNKSYEELKKSFSSQRKRYDKPQYQPFVSEQLPNDLFFSFYKKNSRDFIQSERDYQQMRQIMDASSENNAHLCLGAYGDGELLSAIFFFLTPQRITLAYSASTTEGYKTRANSFLVLEMLKNYQESNYVFDFEGSQLPGVREFFQSFGPKTEHYFMMQYSNPILKPIELFRK